MTHDTNTELSNSAFNIFTNDHPPKRRTISFQIENVKPRQTTSTQIAEDTEKSQMQTKLSRMKNPRAADPVHIIQMVQNESNQ